MLGPALPVLLVVGLLLGVLVHPLAGLLAGLVAAGAVAAHLRYKGPMIIRRSVGGRPADPVGDARLVNLVDALCSSAGVPVPELLVLDEPAPNALCYGLHPRAATLVVTTGLLSTLSRVELEGLLARELATIKNHDIEPATVGVVALGLFGAVPSIASRLRAAAAGTPTLLVDAQGAAITRYPPGLLGALEKLRAAGPAVRAGTAATNHLWLEPPGPTTIDHPPLEERIEALREL